MEGEKKRDFFENKYQSSIDDRTLYVVTLQRLKAINVSLSKPIKLWQVNFSIVRS